MITLDWFENKIKELDAARNFNSIATKVYIGFSGGIDSMVLLDLCYKLRALHTSYDITAVHINHGLNKDAALWENFCKDLCWQKKIKFLSYKVEINIRNDKKNTSLEDLARRARYNVWQKLLKEKEHAKDNVKNKILLLAHHANDQAETVLYRIFRGAGVHGLQGMLEVTQYNNSNIIRPLLTVPKASINEYAKCHALKYIVDDSNFNENFARNFIRHQVIPLLETKWPKVVQKVNNTAVICNEINTYLHDDIEDQYVKFIGSKPNTLSINKLLASAKFTRQAILRSFIEKHDKKMPSSKHMLLIETQIMMARSDALPQIKIADYYITRYRDDLYLLLDAPNALTALIFKESWNLRDPLKLPNAKVLAVKEVNDANISNISNIIVCLGNYGEKAKKVFQKYNIPPWERNQYPVLYFDDKFLGVVGLSELDFVVLV